MNIQQLLMTYGGPVALNNAIIGSGDASGNWVGAWAWDNTTGFGTRFTSPSPTPAGTGYDRGLDINKAKSAVAFGGDNTSFPVYSWSNSGFGTKYANPGTLPVSSGCAAFNGDDTVLGLSQTPSSGNNRISAWAWNNTTGFGTKYTDTSSNSTGNGRWLKWAPDNSYVLMTLQNSPYIRGFPWNNSTGFGTGFTNPSSSISSASPCVDISPNSAYACVTSDFSPWIQAYPVNAFDQFGTKFANPSTAVFSGGYGSSARWNRAGNVIAATNGYQGGTNRLVAYAWSSSGFGTKFAQPSVQVGDALDAFCPIFNNNDTVVFIGLRKNTASTSPNFAAYIWSNTTGFGTKYADPPSTTAAAWVANSGFI